MAAEPASSGRYAPPLPAAHLSCWLSSSRLTQVNNPDASLLVTVWNSKWFLDEFLGVVHLRLRDFRAGQPVEGWYKLGPLSEYDRLKKLVGKGVPLDKGDLEPNVTIKAKPEHYGEVLKEETSRGQIQLKIVFDVKERWLLPATLGAGGPASPRDEKDEDKGREEGEEELGSTSMLPSATFKHSAQETKVAVKEKDEGVESTRERELAELKKTHAEELDKVRKEAEELEKARKETEGALEKCKKKLKEKVAPPSPPFPIHAISAHYPHPPTNSPPLRRRSWRW